MSSQTGRPEYCCVRCRQPICACGTTPQRTAARNTRVYAVLTFPCLIAGCRRVSDTVMARLAHVEHDHARELVPVVGTRNGATP
jgi:hypothetical protein